MRNARSTAGGQIAAPAAPAYPADPADPADPAARAYRDPGVQADRTIRAGFPRHIVAVTVGGTWCIADLEAAAWTSGYLLDGPDGQRLLATRTA